MYQLNCCPLAYDPFGQHSPSGLRGTHSRVFAFSKSGAANLSAEVIEKILDTVKKVQKLDPENPSHSLIALKLLLLPEVLQDLNSNCFHDSAVAYGSALLHSERIVLCRFLQSQKPHPSPSSQCSGEGQVSLHSIPVRQELVCLAVVSEE